MWAADKVDYLRKLITSEGSGRKTYQKAERHLGGRFSVEQILLKCKALQAKDRKNPKSSAPLPDNCSKSISTKRRREKGFSLPEHRALKLLTHTSDG